VPDDSWDAFVFELGSRAEVLKDSDLVPPPLLRNLKQLTVRAGWYIQQFAKLAPLVREVDAYHIAMIWDGDTVQNRKIQLTRGDQVLYSFIHHFHAPYFEAVHRCLGLDKIVSESFITQYLVVKHNWIHDLVRQLGGAESWLKRLVSSIDFSEKSGFSEYELLGTFINSRFPNEFQRNPNVRLERFGNSHFGGVSQRRRLIVQLLSLRTCLIAYEHWDPIEKAPIRKIITSFLIYQKNRFLLILHHIKTFLLRSRKSISYEK